MDRATLSYRDEPDIEVERDGGAEDEATCFHARDLRDSARSERRGKRVDGPGEKPPSVKSPRMSVWPSIHRNRSTNICAKSTACPFSRAHGRLGERRLARFAVSVRLEG
jgi:hypothetical protein